MTSRIIHQSSLVRAMLGLTIAAALIGCPDDEAQRALQSVTIAQAAAELDQGDTLQLVALAGYDDGTAQDVSQTADWTSSDPAVVTVDVNGLITAVGPGTATVTATWGAFTSPPVTMTVRTPEPEPELQAIRVFPEQSYVQAGGTLQYLAMGIYTDGGTQEMTEAVTWRSSNSNVVTIAQTGLATAITGGTAEITAEIGTLTSAPALVHVSEAELLAIQIDPPSGTLHAGSNAKLEFTATAIFSDGTSSEVTKFCGWASDDEDMATVKDGVVSAGNQSGQALITASLAGVESQAAPVQILPSSDVESIAVTAKADTFAAGYGTEMTAMATYADGRVVDVTHDAAWQSLNQSVATIDDHGQVAGLKPGSATITATLDGVSGSLNVTVTDALLLKLELEPTNVSLPAGVQQQFVATGSFSDGSTADVSGDAAWVSSNPVAASITPMGLAMGLAPGASTIKASLDGQQASALLAVTNAKLEQLWIEPAMPATLAAGFTFNFKVMGAYSDGSELNLTANDHVTWSSSDPNVAQVSNTAGSQGLASALAGGVTEIGALYNDGGQAMVADGVPFTVLAALLEQIQVTPLEATIPDGKFVQFEAKGFYSDGSWDDITGSVLWKSNAPNLATVNQAGQATGAGVGQAIISASLQGMEAQATLTVTPAVLELVVLTPGQPEALPVGVTLQFEAMGTYSNGNEVDLTASPFLTWHSAFPEVATVSNAAGDMGMATAMAEGGTHVYAVFDDGTAMQESPPVLVSVIPAAIIDLMLEPAAANLPLGMQQAFMAKATFSDLSQGDVTDIVQWTSSEPAIAEVDAMGVVTGKSLGVALIKAEWMNIEASAPLTVTPAVLASLEISPADPAALPVGLDQAFTAKGYFTDGSTLDMTAQPDLTWMSSNPLVAVIDAGGVAMGMSEGGTLISAEYADGVMVKAAPVLLSVVPPLLEAIVVDPATADIPAGSEMKFFATGTFSDGTTRDISMEVEWSSGSPAVATVDSQGNAHGLTAGSADIFAKSAELMGGATLAVNDAQLVAIQIDPAAPADLPVGLDQSFTATGLYTDGSNADLTKNPQLTWISSAPGVAMINVGADKCAAVGLAEGGTMISAIFDDGEITVAAKAVPLAVVPALLKALEIDPINPSVAHGFDVAFTATGKFSDGSIKDLTEQVTWTSSNTSVAGISNAPGLEGIATGKTPGQSFMKAELASKSAMTSMIVTGADLVAIGVDPPAVNVSVGLSHQFMATGNFNDGSTMDLTKLVTWSVHPSDLGRGVTISNATSREGLATVAVTAEPSLNPVTLQATLGSVSGVAELTIVNPVTLIGIQVAVEPTVIPVGLSAQATALGLYSDGVHPPEAIDITDAVTWEPDADNVVAVSNAGSSKGTVTGLNAGVALVNACLGALCANDFTGPGNAAIVFVTDCPFDFLVIQPNNSSAKKLPRGTSRKYTVEAHYDVTAGFACGLLGGVTYDLTELASWSTSNPAVATVSNKAGNRGFVQAAQSPPQTAVTLRAMYEALLVEMSLTVIDACVDTITVSPDSATLPAGVRKQFSASAKLTDGSSIDYTDLATWQVTGDLGLVGDGFIQTYAGDAGTLKAIAKASGQCAKVEAVVPITINDAVLTSISVAPPIADVAIGSVIWFEAMGHFSDGTSFDQTDLATWSSVNPAVATAGASGKVKGQSDGQVIVLATVGKVTGTATVAVGGIDLVKITIQPNAAFACGDFGGKGYMANVAIPLEAEGIYSDGSKADLTNQVAWASDAGFINVSSNGLAATVSPGSAEITAMLDGVTGKKTFKVLDTTLESIKLVPGNNFVIPVNSTRQFTATGTYSATVGGAAVTDKCDITGVVNWKAAPGASLTINAMGLVSTTGTPTTSAAVTAQKDAVVKVVNGKVVGACIADLRVEPPGTTTTVGISKQFTATAVLSDGSTFDVTDSPDTAWTTTNPAVAGVTDGLAAPVGSGVADISATYKAGNAACVGVGKFITRMGALQVTPAALSQIVVTCDGTNATWPGPFGPVKGLPVGLVTQCYATGHYVDGTSASITDSVNWFSSDSDVVSVSNSADEKGKATTLASGFANITAEFGGTTGSHTFGAVSAAIDQVKVYGAATQPAGFSEPYTADGRFTLGAKSRWYNITQLANWASTNANVATVDNAANKGFVTTHIAGGPLDIEAAYLGQKGAKTITVLDVVLDHIDLTPAKSTLAIGQKRQWTAMGFYIDTTGTPHPKDISHLASWFTTDPAIASVDATGFVTTHGLGNVAIVAELAAASGDAQLTVEDKCIVEVDIKPSALSLPAGVPLTFQVIAYYTFGPPQDVTDQVVFKTSDAGRMGAPDTMGWSFTEIGAAPGEVTITGTMNNGGCTGKPNAKSVVTVNAAALGDISVFGNPPFVPIGLKTQYNAVGHYSDGTSYDITRTIDAWKSGNKEVATVSNYKAKKGQVTGISLGDAPITATQESLTGGSTVQVTSATLVGLYAQGFRTTGKCRNFQSGSSWIDTDFMHPVGGYTTWVRVWGTFSDGSTAELTQSVTWSTSDYAKAVVSNAPGFEGRINTGAASGDVTITATHTSGVVGKIDLTVVPAQVDLLVLNASGPDPVKLALGNQHQLSLRGRFGSTFYCVTENGAYIVEGPSVTVSNSAGTRGRLDTLTLGDSVVTTFIGTVNDTILVQVADPTLETIHVTPAAVDMLIGETAQLRAYANFSDGTVNEVTWNAGTTWFTGNAAVAELTATKGLIRAKGVGNTFIDVCLNAVCAAGSNTEATVEVDSL